MATNKNATVRYQVLNRCFRNPGKKYFIDDLVDECNTALSDLDDFTSGVKKRQVYDDIKFMKDSLGYSAPIVSFRLNRKTYYRYDDLNFSINNQPLNQQEAQQLKESLLTLSRFSGLPQFEWVEEITARLEQSFNLRTPENVISFEENPYLTGKEFLGELYTAIVNKQVLEIEYHPFTSPDSIIYVIHPYHLKQYNNRWFLIGLNEAFNTLSNIALDRIRNIKMSQISLRENTTIDFSEYYEDIIGVSIPEEKKLEIVEIAIDIKAWPYVKTKPLHGSQKIVEVTNEYALIKIEVMLNYELETLILSLGEGVAVIEPTVLREKIAVRLRKNLANY